MSGLPAWHVDVDHWKRDTPPTHFAAFRHRRPEARFVGVGLTDSGSRPRMRYATVMRVFAVVFVFLAVLAAAPAADVLNVFGGKWTVEHASDWSVENGVLRLKVSAEPPAGQPRRPTKIALLDSKPYRKVTIEGEVKRNARSLILVYAWQDETHYNYAHMSSDAAAKQVVHNGMFHVFGGERVRMSPLDGPPSFDTQDWTPIKLVFDGDTGRCTVEVAGRKNPSLEAVDMSLRWGRVGLGSFNETGDFRNIRVTGETREPGPFGHQ